MPAFHNGKGIGVPTQEYADPLDALAPLGFNDRPFQFYDWSYRHWNHPDDRIRNCYQPMAYSFGVVKNSDFAEAVRGSRQAWMIANEPDQHDQANLMPNEAVDLVVAMKRINYNLRWMGPNVCLNREFAWGYMTEFVRLLRRTSGFITHGLDSEFLLPEAWAVHCYGLEHSIWGWPHHITKSFDAWWARFKKWMIDNHCQRPVFLTEINADNTGGSRYWPAVHDALLNHVDELIHSWNEPLLQGYFWFSPRYQIDRTSDLLTESKTPTMLGRTFLEK